VQDLNLKDGTHGVAHGRQVVSEDQGLPALGDKRGYDSSQTHQQFWMIFKDSGTFLEFKSKVDAEWF
jgi:hypothetical protein